MGRDVITKLLICKVSWKNSCEQPLTYRCTKIEKWPIDEKELVPVSWYKDQCWKLG